MMTVATFLDWITSGRVEATYTREQYGEMARVVFISHDPVIDIARSVAALQADEPDEEVSFLMALVVFNDARACPSPDAHRATYKYNTRFGCIACDACATVREEAARLAATPRQ